MNKFIVAVMSACLATVAQGSQSKKELAPARISIYVPSDQVYLRVPIDAATTIAAVKKYLEKENGFPAGGQRIHLIRRAPGMRYVVMWESIAPKDAANVCQLMRKYNTEKFELSLFPLPSEDKRG